MTITAWRRTGACSPSGTPVRAADALGAAARTVSSFSRGFRPAPLNRFVTSCHRNISSAAAVTPLEPHRLLQATNLQDLGQSDPGSVGTRADAPPAFRGARDVFSLQAVAFCFHHDRHWHRFRHHRRQPRRRELGGGGWPRLLDTVQLRAMCGRLRVGKSFLHVLQHWSVQPCVRPLDAVHMTAGHNALRGSGPGQKHAFDSNAMAQVGCPDRRIDRLCITCCSPSQPSHHAGCPARSRLRRKRDGLPVTLALGHHGPGHSG